MGLIISEDSFLECGLTVEHYEFVEKPHNKRNGWVELQIKISEAVGMKPAGDVLVRLHYNGELDENFYDIYIPQIDDDSSICYPPILLKRESFNGENVQISFYCKEIVMIHQEDYMLLAKQKPVTQDDEK